MIEVKELKEHAELRQFVEFPFSIFKNNPNWIPPIINEELETFDPQKNPVFENAQARFFMAFKNGRPVGRIAAITNRIETEEQGNPKVRFGWFDVVDDIEVTKALLDKVRETGEGHDLKFMEGPVGFSNMDKAGMLVEGFDEMGTMITWYSQPYYKEHLERLDFAKEKEWVEFKIILSDELPEKVRKFSNLILERYDLKVLRFSNKKEVIKYADEMFDLINKTYSQLSTFVPIQPEQIAHYKEKYFRYIHPDFINCIADKDGNLVAFAITMPSFAKALQKANGRLFPTGWFYLLKNHFFPKKAAFYLIGIDPKYQNKGVTGIIFKEMHQAFIKKGITEVETNPELEENKAIQALWNRYESRLHKRRRTYKKELADF